METIQTLLIKSSKTMPTLCRYTISQRNFINGIDTQGDRDNNMFHGTEFS